VGILNEKKFSNTIICVRDGQCDYWCGAQFKSILAMRPPRDGAFVSPALRDYADVFRTWHVT
jgi:hypothetical protein